MADSVYKVIELIGSSTESWEAAAKSAVETAAQSLNDVRVARVVEMDIRINENKVVEFRTRLKVSFKYHSEMSR